MNPLPYVIALEVVVVGVVIWAIIILIRGDRNEERSPPGTASVPKVAAAADGEAGRSETPVPGPLVRLTPTSPKVVLSKESTS